MANVLSTFGEQISNLLKSPLGTIAAAAILNKLAQPSVPAKAPQINTAELLNQIAAAQQLLGGQQNCHTTPAAPAPGQDLMQLLQTLQALQPQQPQPQQNPDQQELEQLRQIAADQSVQIAQLQQALLAAQQPQPQPRRRRTPAQPNPQPAPQPAGGQQQP